MKQDPALRALIRALTEATDPPTDRDVQRIVTLRDAFKPSRTALDVDQVMAELGNWDQPISPEIRFALMQFFSGKITMKRGPKRPPASALQVQFAAYEVLRRHRELHITMQRAIKDVALEFAVTTHAINATLYPRNHPRKQ